MSSSPFVGRRTEFDDLTALLDGIETEHGGRTVVLVGPAGSGKTRLAQELTARARRDGLAVHWSIGEPLADGPALGPWRYLIEQLDPGTTIRDVEGSRTRWDTFNALIAHLLGVIHSPTVVVLDDLHRSDDDTLAFTRFAAPALQRLPLLVVGTWKTTGTDTRLERLLEVVPAIEVLAMDDLDARELAMSVAGRPQAPEILDAIVGAAGGNPMHLRELAKHPSHPDIAAPLKVLLAHRLRELDGDPSLIAGAITMHRGPVSTALLAELAGVTGDAVRETASRSTGLLVARGDLVWLHHDLVGEAALANLGPTRLRDLHLRAADVLARLPDGRLMCAEHLERAAEFGYDDARRRFDAARAAAAHSWQGLAWRASLDWFRRASEIAHTAGLAERWRASLEHAVALQRCGLLVEARAVFVEICRGDVDDPVIAADAALGVPGIWVEEQRDPVERIQMLAWCRDALGRLPPEETGRRSELSVRLAAERFYDGGDLDDVQTALDDVRASNDRAALARSLSLFHHCLLTPEHGIHGPDHLVRRRDIAEELIDNAVGAGEEFSATVGLLWQVVDLYLDGESGADTLLVPLRRRIEALQIDSLGYIVDVIDVMLTIRSGEFERAEHASTRAMERGLAAGDNDALAYRVGQLACIRWLQGRIGELEPALREVLDSGTLRRHDRLYPAMLALVCARRGDLAGAASIARGLMADQSDDDHPVRRTSTWTASMAALGEYAWVAGDRAVADWVLETLRPFSGSLVMPSLAVVCLGPLDLTLGLCASTLGRVDDATKWFRSADEQNAVPRNLPVGVLISAHLATALRATDQACHISEADELEHSARRQAAALGMDLPPMATCASPREILRDGDRSDETNDDIRRSLGRFEQHEQHWVVALGDQNCEVADSIGMRYLALLLSNPNRPIHATELSEIVHDHVVAHARAPASPVFDAEALTVYRRRLDQIHAELEHADRRGDAAASQRWSSERDAILDEVRRGTGLRGRSRRLDDDSERARGRVGAAIRRSLRSISVRDPSLGHQLTGSIRLGYACVYIPDPAHRVDWEIRS